MEGPARTLSKALLALEQSCVASSERLLGLFISPRTQIMLFMDNRALSSFHLGSAVSGKSHLCETKDAFLIWRVYFDDLPGYRLRAAGVYVCPPWREDTKVKKSSLHCRPPPLSQARLAASCGGF